MEDILIKDVVAVHRDTPVSELLPQMAEKQSPTQRRSSTTRENCAGLWCEAPFSPLSLETE
ncbi:hypothetical protein GCM10011571_28020 [Marinithermofilum abyssi]|uniref:Uncharacterized protein n=1 Tax=Marinithermofilum abyssi TaxID=1571185 RepID=A0A8J2VD91_9BACL|nr:hypothetical protein GCM10011571_28020 [Marinithermofilum abyssi]